MCFCEVETASLLTQINFVLQNVISKRNKTKFLIYKQFAIQEITTLPLLLPVNGEEQREAIYVAPITTV
jgi:hypothetical protein